MDQWTRALGSRQGRIVPDGFTPPDGTHVMCLGADRAGMVIDLDFGDGVIVSQTANFAGAKFVALHLRYRCPDTVEYGTWVAEVLIDDELRVRRPLVAGRTRSMADVGLCIADLSPANHALKVRLFLEGLA